MDRDGYLERLEAAGYKLNNVSTAARATVPDHGLRICEQGHSAFHWLSPSDDPEVLEFDARKAEAKAGACGHPPKP